MYNKTPNGKSVEACLLLEPAFIDAISE